MAQELHLQNAATFGDAHSKRVLALPGRERFRTGISLQVSAKKLSELSKLGPWEDRFMLFVSLPYFGKSGSITSLGPESESGELRFQTPGNWRSRPQCRGESGGQG